MRRIIRITIGILSVIIFVLVGVLIIEACICETHNKYIIALMGYFISIYFLSKTHFFSSHVMPNIRGGYYSFKLNNHPKKLRIGKNVKIFNPHKISFGENCNIGEGVVFAPLCKSGGMEFPSEIRVGNNVHFGTQDRIASMNSVTIEDDVLFAAFVHVTDHSHEYRKVPLPIRSQSVYGKGPVLIKRGAWLAFGCHILSGVTVGECSVVAANSVVTKDVPPYSVVAGNPARVICTYDFNDNAWKRVQRGKEDELLQ